MRARTRTGEAIRFILVMQLAMGAWLVTHDLSATLPRLFAGRGVEDLTAPTAPGDQTRRYDPALVPRLPAPPGTRHFPQLEDMPERLRFERTGPEARLTGAIAEGDAGRFADWLEEQAVPPRRIWLSSPGGSVGDALAIGRLVRTAGMSTAMEPGDACLSACPYILAAGVLREVADGALVGVHQHYFGENTVLPAFLAVRDIQRGQAEVVGYLTEMGIDLRLMQPALATPPEEIYILTAQELERFRLTTRSDPP
nr:hypothetical protein [Frigidibacter sp. ROC022]